DRPAGPGVDDVSAPRAAAHGDARGGERARRKPEEHTAGPLAVIVDDADVPAARRWVARGGEVAADADQDPGRAVADAPRAPVGDDGLADGAEVDAHTVRHPERA